MVGFDNFYALCESSLQLKRQKLISQLNLTDVEFQSFETTKCIALYISIIVIPGVEINLNSISKDVNQYIFNFFYSEE